jgi:hypothetical protein
MRQHVNVQDGTEHFIFLILRRFDLGMFDWPVITQGVSNDTVSVVVDGLSVDIPTFVPEPTDGILLVVDETSADIPIFVDKLSEGNPACLEGPADDKTLFYKNKL